LYIVVCLCSDDFGVARRKAKKAEQTSDLDTAASEIEKESRKRRAKAFLEDDASVCSVPVPKVIHSKISKKSSGTKKILFPAALLTPPPPPAALTSSTHILASSTSTPSPSAGSSIEAQHRPTPPIPAAPTTSPHVLASTPVPAAATSLNARQTVRPDATQASKRGMKHSWLLVLIMILCKV